MNLVITMSRQMGSGGTTIGQAVARRLGIPYVDRQILDEAAAIIQEDPEVVARCEERIFGFVDMFLHGLAVGSPDAGCLSPPFRKTNDAELFHVQSEIIRRIGGRQSAVIVGRAGWHALKGHPCLLNVFIHAPLPFRYGRIRESYVSDPRDARERVDTSDADRRRFIEKMTGESWTDARNYHVCLDTAKTGIAGAVDMIISLAGNIRSERL